MTLGPNNLSGGNLRFYPVLDGLRGFTILSTMCLFVLNGDFGMAAALPQEAKPAVENSMDEETDRQKEQRAAVEKERKARGGSTKTLKTKLAELSRTPDKQLDLTFDDLIFEMEKGEPFLRSMITKEISQIHKKKVSLSGYLRPSVRQKGITQFVFVRDNKECCFGPGAALFDCVLVRLAEGEETEYTVRPITVEGEFYLKEFKGPNGRAWAIYRMKNGHVK